MKTTDIPTYQELLSHHNINIRVQSTYLIVSKISGFEASLSFILSFMAMMIVLALSSAPCFELFSAAPELRTQNYTLKWLYHWQPTTPTIQTLLICGVWCKCTQLIKVNVSKLLQITFYLRICECHLHHLYHPQPGLLSSNIVQSASAKKPVFFQCQKRIW